MRGQSGGKVKKISEKSENFKVVRGTYPSAFGSARIGPPIPTLSKALGQVSPFPYGERPIPALFEALE